MTPLQLQADMRKNMLGGVIRDVRVEDDRWVIAVQCGNERMFLTVHVPPGGLHVEIAEGR